MSLPLLVAMVVAGIGAIVAAIHFTGGTRRVRLGDAEHAAGRFREDFPEEQVSDVRLTASGDAAFLELAGGRLGLVQSFGDRFLTRIVAPADIIGCRRIGERAVSMRLADFTLTGGIYTFADPRDADAVAAWLGADLPIQDAVEAV